MDISITTPAAVAMTLAPKLLGKTADAISSDIAKLYEKGRDKIIETAVRKTVNLDDKKSANLRVARDVFWNGSFTDESICAEYFGGILASSRSLEGKDDSGVFYVDIIKSLSSKQLTLHYLIYYCLNKLLFNDANKVSLNPGQENQLQGEEIFLSSNEIIKIINDAELGRDLFALHSKDLIGDFQTDNFRMKDNRLVPYLKASPKALGIQLYAVAHNKFENWRQFAKIDFGEFSDVACPQYFGKDVPSLLDSAGLKDEEVQTNTDQKAEDKNGA